MKLHHDAELHHWYRRHNSLVGRVWNDSKGRFEDGLLIVTSRVIKEQNGVAQTLNTKYLLVGPERTDV